jgi:hypothetical protein
VPFSRLNRDLDPCALAERDSTVAKDVLAASGEDKPINNEAVHFNRSFVKGIVAPKEN